LIGCTSGNWQFGGFCGDRHARKSRGQGVRHRLDRSAIAAGEWSTEILASANAAAKDPNGKVKVRVTGPTTFDPQRQVQMFLAELETKPDVLIVVNVSRSSSAQAWPARFGPLYMPRSTRAALP